MSGKILPWALLCVFVLILIYHFNFLGLSESMKNRINGGRLITLYYAAWCGHCHQMLPVYDQVKEAARGRNINFNMIDVDKVQTDVSLVPTIIMIDEFGRTSKYEGGANYEQLLRWVLAVH